MHHEEEGLPVFQDLSDVVSKFFQNCLFTTGVGRLRVLVNKTLSKVCVCVCVCA
jgi:hypothetical protein